MKIRPEFYPQELKALLPWRGYVLTLRDIVIGAVVFGGLLTLMRIVGGNNSIPQLALIVSFGVALFLGTTLLYRRHVSHRAVAIDAEGIAAPGLFGMKYVGWREVRMLAHAPSLLGPSRAPIEFALLVVPRGRRPPMRLSLPDLEEKECNALVDILTAIAERHGFEFIQDYTEDGRNVLGKPQRFWR
ncbi:MAG: hypothetical protein ABIO40_06525 [Devosia sp.]